MIRSSTMYCNSLASFIKTNRREFIEERCRDCTIQDIAVNTSKLMSSISNCEEKPSISKCTITAIQGKPDRSSIQSTKNHDSNQRKQKRSLLSSVWVSIIIIYCPILVLFQFTMYYYMFKMTYDDGIHRHLNNKDKNSFFSKIVVNYIPDDKQLLQRDAKTKFPSTIHLSSNNIYIEVPYNGLNRSDWSCSMRARTVACPSHLLISSNETQPDFGSLQIAALASIYSGKENNTYFLQEKHHSKIYWIQRIIDPNDENAFLSYHTKMLNSIDSNDDDMKWYDFNDNDYESVNCDTCVTPKWSYTSNPTCMTFHETYGDALKMSITSTIDSSITSNTSIDYVLPATFLGAGSFRESWLFESILTSSKNQKESDSCNWVTKHLRFDQDYDISQIAGIRTEALLLSEFTSSPNFINIYGYCGTSIMLEPAYEISHGIVPFIPEMQTQRGLMEQTVLDELEIGGIPHPMNTNLTVERKLDIAISIAESIAALHGNEYGAVVHEDIHPDQWLVTKDGRVVLNDMNIAEFLPWNYNKSTYCKYYISFSGRFHSPEESIGGLVDESADIWPVGNVLFSLITGLWTYYHETRDDDYIPLDYLSKGVQPYLNPQYYNRSCIEKRMIEIMEKCHVVDPSKRVSIFDVVMFLKETKLLNNINENKKYAS